MVREITGFRLANSWVIDPSRITTSKVYVLLSGGFFFAAFRVELGFVIVGFRIWTRLEICRL